MHSPRLLFLICLAAGGLIPRPTSGAVCAYVARAENRTLAVIDVGTRTVVDAVDVGIGPRGVAVGPNGAGTPRVYVANSEAATVTVIDTATLGTLRTIQVGAGPEEIVALPGGEAVYVSHPTTGMVSVINATSLALATTIDVGGEPRGLDAAADGAIVLVADPTSDELVVIDTATNSVVDRFETAPGPVDVAVDAVAAMAYVSSLPISVVHTGTGEPSARLNIRPSSDVRGIAVGSAYAFLCNKDSTGGHVVLIPTDPEARTFPLPSIALGAESEPRDIVAIPDSSAALMTDGTDDRVAVLDADDGLLMSIPVGSDPHGIAIASLSGSCRPEATATPTDTSATPTPTPVAGICPGDCNANGTVAINELILGVNIALGNAAVGSCQAFDANGNGSVTINELIAAVNAALNGCPTAS